MATEKKFWWHMDNGQQRRTLDFTIHLHVVAGGKEQVHTYTASNPPIYDSDPNTFSRLSFEGIKSLFERKFAMEVGHIIRGEVSENGGVRDCYVFAPGRRVPFAVIRPSVFEP